MILDNVDHWPSYVDCHPELRKAIDFLARAERESLPAGKYVISSSCYAMIQEYVLPIQSMGKWESHQQYIDLQIIIEGSERIDWKQSEKLVRDGNYIAENDIQFYREAEGTALCLEAGQWVIFFPQDAHRPQCAIGNGGKVRKIVVKLPCINSESLVNRKEHKRPHKISGTVSS